MKLKKKIISGALTLMLTASLLTGCGNSGSNVLDFSNSTLSGTITAVDGDKVTVSMTSGFGGGRMGNRNDASAQSADGEQTMPEGTDNQTPPTKPGGSDGEAPADMPKGTDGEAPADMPEGTNGEAPADMPEGTNGEAPADMPEGEMPSGDDATMGGGMDAAAGNMFSQGGSTFTLTITDESLLEECTMDDITEGSFITITFGDNNTITSITVMKLTNSQDGTTPNGQGGAAPEGQESTTETGTSANNITEDTEEADVAYSSTNDDENALRVEGIIHYTADGLTIDKTGETSNTESSDFYGQNAGFLTLDGGTSTITNSTITTNGKGANGIFAYGSGSNVTVSDTTITTTADNSGGIDVTGGASIQASNLTIETNGNSSAAIRSDRGGGTLTVDGGTYTTNGTGSPAVYCTADITVSNATLNATASEGAVIEGKNSVTLENCEITGNMQGTYHGDENENLHTLMIYQSMSGDADEGEANMTITGGSVTGLNGDLIYSTNTTSVLSLNNVALTLSNDTLLRVCGNDGSRGWGTVGNNGADMKFNATNQILTGNIIVDEISTLIFTMSEGSTFEGAINTEQDGGEVSVILDDSSTWTLTADSYITSLEGSLDNINMNGFTLYVDGVAQ